MPTGAIARTQKAAKTASGCNCFVGGTEVLTPAGEKPIEQVRVGQRVLTYAPGEFEGSRPPVTELDAATTKQITLTLGEDPHATAPGPGSPLTTVVLLRSDEWVEAKRLEVGGTIPLDLAELGVKGLATVAKIEDCPELEEPTEGIDSDGTRLVTATFHHTLGYPLDLKLEGLDTPLGVTKHHLIYSEDRQDWVEVGGLETHERVRVAGDVLEVEYAHARPQAEAVYNLEVDGDHVYRVTDAGVLVHNQSCKIEIDFVGKNVGASTTGIRIAEEIAGALKQSSRILDTGNTGGTVWGKIYQRALQSGGYEDYLLPIFKGNALQQITDRQLRRSTVIIDAAVLLNVGHLLKYKNKAGNILRPDYQLLLPGKGLIALDITTPRLAAKIFKYDGPGVAELISITYRS